MRRECQALKHDRIPFTGDKGTSDRIDSEARRRESVYRNAIVRPSPVGLLGAALHMAVQDDAIRPNVGNVPAGVRFLDRRTPPHIVTLILIMGIAVLSMNVFLPSLPAMTEYFGTDYRFMQLSVAIYLGVNAVLQVVVGPLSDRLGRRPVVLGGLVIFIVASVGCVFAPTVETFLAFRMLQGTVVVGMVLSRAIVRDTVPQDQAASMIGYVTMGMAVVPMLGPAIGGYARSTRPAGEAVLDEARGRYPRRRRAVPAPCRATRRECSETARSRPMRCLPKPLCRRSR